MRSMILLTFVILISVTLVYASASEEYISEFNNLDETCEIIDYFVYDIRCPIFFNSERYCSSVPVFYKCCSKEDCITILFDAQNADFLSNSLNSELINLNYIKYSLDNGNMSLTQFDLKGFDVCSYFGTDEIRQESVNIATSTAENIAPTVLNAEKAHKVKKTINTAKKVGKVSKFNPTTLIASVSCVYDDKKLKQAIESLYSCNSYLSNIQNNYAKEGYITHFTEEVNLARLNLKEYIDSPTAQIRGGTNTLFNMIASIFRFFMDLGSGKEAKLEIEKTELDLAREAYSMVSNYNPYIENPNNALILLRHNTRINSKISEYNFEYNSLTTDYKKIKSLKPSIFRVLLTNFFMKPNYNISTADKYFSNAKQSKRNAENLIKVYKFNSAINQISHSSNYLNLTEPIYVRENKINRRIDVVFLFILIILGIAGYFLYEKYT